MNLSNTLRISLLAAVCGLASSLAFAADPPPEDILRGPDIQDRDVPGAPGTFGDAKNRGGKRPGAADQRQQQRAMMGALRSLEGDDVAPDLRLTEDQQAQIKAIAEELRTATEAFRAEHKDEIDALKAQAGDMRANGDRAGKRPEPMDAPGRAEAKADLDKRSKADPDVAAAREKLKAIHESAPKPEAYTTRMWAVLSAPQQALVQSRMDLERDDMRSGMDERKPERRRERGAENKDNRGAERQPQGNRGRGADAPNARFAPAPPAAPRADGRPGPRGDDANGGAAERFDRLRNRFNELSPEAQERVLERFEEMLARMGDRRGPRPAPSIDDVNVPPPPADAPMPEVH